MTIWPHINSEGRRMGYARVSTADQKLHMQLDGLRAVNCDRIFSDHGVSGAKASRPGLDEMLSALREGDAFRVQWADIRAVRINEMQDDNLAL